MCTCVRVFVRVFLRVYVFVCVCVQVRSSCIGRLCRGEEKEREFVKIFHIPKTCVFSMLSMFSCVPSRGNSRVLYTKGRVSRVCVRGSQITKYFASPPNFTCVSVQETAQKFEVHYIRLAFP